MKRFILLLAMGLAALPFAAQADDIPDGEDCQNGEAAPYTHHYQSLDDPTTADPNNLDRSSTCIHVEGTTVFYIGGELQAEEDPGFGGTCGSIIVMGEGVDSGNGQDWNNAGPDGEPGTEDDQHCD